MTSERFVNGHIPCEDCLVRPTCNDFKHLPQNIQFDGRALYLQKWDLNKKDYYKGVMECWANIGHDIMCRAHCSINNDPSKMNERLFHFLIEITGMLQWIINSTSWEKSTLYEFDLDEIKRMLNMCKIMLPNNVDK